MLLFLCLSFGQAGLTIGLTRCTMYSQRQTLGTYTPFDRSQRQTLDTYTPFDRSQRQTLGAN